MHWLLDRICIASACRPSGCWGALDTLLSDAVAEYQAAKVEVCYFLLCFDFFFHFSFS